MVAAVETMAYSGELPWHGLGTKVMPDLSPKEMMKASGTDWTVSKQPLYFNKGGIWRKTEQTALMRDSDGSILSYVPDDWNPCQNEQAFDFFKEFVDRGEMEMHTAGSLLNGRRVWALAKVNDAFKLRFGKKEDVVENFLLFSNPHEFGRTITIDMTAIRVVCNNTLTLALSKASANLVKINHSNVFNPEVAKEMLFNAHKQLEEYKERAEFLASKKAEPEKVKEYFNVVFPSFSKKEEAANDNGPAGSRNAKTAMEVLETQPGAKLGEGTWWQPFNAVTYLMDHHLGRSQENRVNNIWFGQMRDKKVTALNKALDFARAA